MDDDTIAFGEADEVQKGKLTHPHVTLFHLVFRVTAIIVYMFCGWFSKNFIASFVTVVLLLSMQFWTVKNITRRLMVGLKQWNCVDDNGVTGYSSQERVPSRTKSILPSQEYFGLL